MPLSAPGVGFTPIQVPDVLKDSLAQFNSILQSSYAPQLQQQNLQQQIADTLIKQSQAQYAPQMNAADLAYKLAQTPNLQANTALTQQQAQYYGPKTLSDINLQGAQAANAQQEANKLIQTNPLAAQELAAKIAETKAQANYFNQGGGRGGVDVVANNQFHQAIANANPQFANDPDKLLQAATALRNGEKTMLDGTPIRTSGDTDYWGDVTSKQRTTSALVTQGVQANQAAAELPLAQKFVQQGLAPYGNTIFNKSPKQIVDTFSSDDASQDRLGRLIAAKQLNYDIAQMQTKIANGRPGVTTTEELMRLSGQNIDDRYPMLSDRARQAAQATIEQAMNVILAARNQVGYGARQLNMGAGNTANPVVTSTANNSQMLRVSSADGSQTGSIPADRVKDFMAKHPGAKVING